MARTASYQGVVIQRDLPIGVAAEAVPKKTEDIFMGELVA